MTIDNIVMWVIQHNTVEWNYSKTQTLLGTLNTENRPREKLYVSLDVERSFPQVGCVRNKLQSLTQFY